MDGVYTSQAQNCYHVYNYNAFGQPNPLVQRDIFDTATTSITASPYEPVPPHQIPHELYKLPQPLYQVPQCNYFSEGVAFTFGSQQPLYYQNPVQNLTWYGIENSQLLKDIQMIPYRLKFTQNVGTITDDFQEPCCKEGANADFKVVQPPCKCEKWRFDMREEAKILNSLYEETKGRDVGVQVYAEQVWMESSENDEDFYRAMAEEEISSVDSDCGEADCDCTARKRRKTCID